MRRSHSVRRANVYYLYIKQRQCAIIETEVDIDMIGAESYHRNDYCTSCSIFALSARCFKCITIRSLCMLICIRSKRDWFVLDVRLKRQVEKSFLMHFPMSRLAKLFYSIIPEPGSDAQGLKANKATATFP